MIAWLIAAALAASPPAPARPNVIVILTDDQGWADAGCYGATDLRTPAIDGLARRGVRFTRFYAAAPICSPSRAGLLTGRYPLRAGVPNNVGTAEAEGLPPGEVTMAEVLRKAGYATALVGKWHLGQHARTGPNAQGFDSAFGFLDGCIDNYSHFFYWGGPNRHDLSRDGREVHRPGRFFPDLMVEEAGRFLEANRDRPSFLYFAMNAPHYPYQGDPRWLDRYASLPYPRNLYAAFLSTADERIGRLLSKVDELGLRDRTLIVFQSDHGFSTEDRAHGGGGSAGPLRGAKFSLFEGGIRVPAIVSWPGRIPEGRVRDQVAHGCDWLPTIASYCEVPAPPDLDGRDLSAAIASADAPSPHPVLHWQVGRGPSARWAVRRGDWKLIGNPGEGGSLFLSDLARDEPEAKDHAADRPDVVRDMRRLHDDWGREAERAR